MSLLSDIIDIAVESNKTWQDRLNKASYRGVPFAVYGGEARFGRRQAVHEYPGRNVPYIEDLGRSTRRIRMSGFIVTDSAVYGGGDVLAQRDALVAAVERAGPGKLMHPTLGELNVSIVDGGFSVIERWDMGRYFEISFIFIESGERVFPNIKSSSKSLLEKLADALGLGGVLDFVKKVIGFVKKAISIVEGVIKFGKAIVGMVVGVIAGFKVLVGRITSAVKGIMGLAGLLTGNTGRYSNGNVSSALIASRKQKNTSMEDLIAKNTANRAAVDEAMDRLTTSAEALDASNSEAFTAALDEVMKAIVASVADPGDAITLLGPLATYRPETFTSDSDLGIAKNVAQEATSALIRRAAIAAIARVSADYAPASHDQAIDTMNGVVGYIDAEILIAGDAGDDESYNALRDLRGGIVTAFTTSGATLPRLETFSFKAPMPSLVMVNRLYQDPARERELIEQANPIHPAFMPVSVKALAT